MSNGNTEKKAKSPRSGSPRSKQGPNSADAPPLQPQSTNGTTFKGNGNGIKSNGNGYDHETNGNGNGYTNGNGNGMYEYASMMMKDQSAWQQKLDAKMEMTSHNIEEIHHAVQKIAEHQDEALNVQSTTSWAKWSLKIIGVIVMLVVMWALMLLASTTAIMSTDARGLPNTIAGTVVTTPGHSAAATAATTAATGTGSSSSASSSAGSSSGTSGATFYSTGSGSSSTAGAANVTTAGGDALAAFDPNEVAHPDITFHLCGELTKNVKLYTLYSYILDCHVNVEDGVTMTIEAGVYVRANKTFDSSDVPALYILQGGIIIANGTVDAPITFTSDRDDIQEGDHGLWGGLVILGRAPCIHNDYTFHGQNYGGNLANDYSGYLRYVRVWYGGFCDCCQYTSGSSSSSGASSSSAGRLLAPQSECQPVNAITLAGVGRATTFDYIEAAYSADDGIELHGGTVNMKHVVSYFAYNNGFKIDNGYQGEMQFVFVMVGDIGTGIEVTNDLDVVDAQPRTHPSIRSATMLGNFPHNRGPLMKLHYGAGASMQNWIIQNALIGVEMDHCEGENHIQGKHNMPFDYPNFLYASSNNIIYVTSLEAQDFLPDPSCRQGRPFPLLNSTGTGYLNYAHHNNPQLQGVPDDLDPLPNGALSPVPQPQSPAMNPAVEEVQGIGFFTDVTFAGAFDAAEDVWLRRWTWLDQHLKLLPVAQAGIVNLCGTQRYNRTLSADTIYVLTCQFFIRPNVILTLEPGVTIKCNADASGNSPAIVVEPGAKMIADCTKTAPCTITANEDAALLPAYGKWGGLIICGNAPTQNNNSNVIAGIGEHYGGTNPHDNSGIYRYLRVWYGGHALRPGAHVAALTFAGVGDATIAENIDIAYSEDHGVEFFGGTVNIKYLSVTFAHYSALDFVEGYGGRIQHVFAVQADHSEYGFKVRDPEVHDAMSYPRTHPRVMSATMLLHGDAHEPVMAFYNDAGGTFEKILMAGAMILRNQGCTASLGLEVTQNTPVSTHPEFLFVSKYNIFTNRSEDAPYSFLDGCQQMNVSNYDNVNDEFGTIQPGTTVDLTQTDPARLFNYVPLTTNDPLPEFMLDPRLTPYASGVLRDFERSMPTAQQGPTDTWFDNVAYVGAFPHGYNQAGMWIAGYTWLAENDKLLFTASLGSRYRSAGAALILITISHLCRW